MADSIHILNGDDLDESLLAEALGRTGISDYVERGIVPNESDVDYQNAVVDIPAGKAFVIDAGRDVMLLADARAGVPLATDGINHVFIYYDLSQAEGERIDYHVDSDGTPPDHPALEIAEIDMGTQEVRPQNDTAPIYRRDAETFKGNDIDPEGDGIVTEADSANHVAGSDVEGTVASAATAATAARADTADALGEGVDDAVAVASNTDHQNNVLTDVGSVSLHVGTNSHALKLNQLGLRVRKPNGTLSKFQFQFNPGQNAWVSEAPFRVEHGHDLTLTRDNDTGISFRQTPGPVTNLDTALSRLLPIEQGKKLFDKELFYHYEDGVWVFDPMVRVAGSAVLRRADESGLDVDSADTAGHAATANSATSAGSADVATNVAKKEKISQLIASPNFHTPLVELDPNETVDFGPYATRGRTHELWAWGVMNKNGNNQDGLRLRLRDSSGNQYQAVNQPSDAGDPSTLNPLKAITGANRIVYQLANLTGSKRTISGYASYYLQP